MGEPSSWKGTPGSFPEDEDDFPRTKDDGREEANFREGSGDRMFKEAQQSKEPAKPVDLYDDFGLFQDEVANQSRGSPGADEIKPVAAVAAGASKQVARPVRAVLVSNSVGPVQTAYCVQSCNSTPTARQPQLRTYTWHTPHLRGYAERYSCKHTPFECCWSYLCTWAAHKGCEKSCIQCCCSYTFCLCCIVPDAHRLVFGSSASTFNWSCCALCGCQDCVLMAVPIVGVVGLIEPFKWAVVFTMRRQVVERYHLNESLACSLIATNCLCFCNAMIQQTNEMFVHEDLELSGSCCCACGVQRRVEKPTYVHGRNVERA
ncbi:hypothetical protein AB1Y20_023490 [Prymnesium parvum]|uniref:Phospholipid scramblase n=1 Tax=Prymnesium parvum TaxID=97485 RepID=A0AB34JEF0_PRYPA